MQKKMQEVPYNLTGFLNSIRRYGSSTEADITFTLPHETAREMQQVLRSAGYDAIREDLNNGRTRIHIGVLLS